MKRLVWGVLAALVVSVGSASAQLPVDASSIFLGPAGATCVLRTGSGSPEGAVTGAVCDTYWRTDDGTIWRKASGTGDTGWVSATGLTLVTEDSGNVVVAGPLLPSATDTYDLGRYDRIWRGGYLSKLHSIVHSLTTQTLFGGYSTIGYAAGDFADAVSSAATTIDFGLAMTPGHFVLVRAHDTSGTITAEYITVGSLVSGTTYNVTRDVAGAHGTDPAWAAGTPFLVLGASGTGRIDLLAFDGKPRIAFVEQGATYNAQTERCVLGNLNGYYSYATDIYGLACGSASAANIVIDPTNGIRIRHGTTDKITLTAGGNASFSGAITSQSGTIGGWFIESVSLFAGSGSSRVGLASSGSYAIYAGNEDPALAPFSVTPGGALVATSATITGAITATSGSFTGSLTSTSGTIGGWTLGATSLTAGSGSSRVGLDSGGSNPAIYAGSETPGSAPFRVTAAGALTATSATITGDITATTLDATSGTISGLTVAGAVTLGVGGSVVAGPVTLSSTGLAMSTSSGNGIGWDNGASISAASGPTINITASGLGSQINLGTSLVFMSSHAEVTGNLTVGSLGNDAVCSDSGGTLLNCGENFVPAAVQARLWHLEARLAELESLLAAQGRRP